MLIAVVTDLLVDLGSLARALEDKDYQRTMTELLHTINDIFYMGLFLGGGAPVVASSLCIQFMVGINHSYIHFQKGGERLEGVSHFLMALIRGHQSIREWQRISVERDARKALEEGKPYLPMANKAQKMLVNAGYRVNGFARWTVRQIGHLLLSPMPQERYAREFVARVQTAIKVAFVAPIALTSFLISTPCYLAASYVGTGRFERIEALCSPRLIAMDNKVKVLFQNICGQNPWSLFSGGVVPPLEVDLQGDCRADSIISNILQREPDIYCGQEYDDLDTSAKVGRALAESGYTCIRDLGCNDPVYNHSGLFVAVPPALADSVAFHEFKPEHVSGITGWCHRGVLEATVPLSEGRALKVVNIHLNSGAEPSDQITRLMQFEHYVAPIMNQYATLVVGDSNLDTSRLSEEEWQSGKLSGMVNALEGRVTCADEGKHILNGKPKEGCNDCAERIDVALFNP